MASSRAAWSWCPAASSSGPRRASATCAARSPLASSDSISAGANLLVRRFFRQKLRAMV